MRFGGCWSFGTKASEWKQTVADRQDKNHASRREGDIMKLALPTQIVTP